MFINSILKPKLRSEVVVGKTFKFAMDQYAVRGKSWQYAVRGKSWQCAVCTAYTKAVNELHQTLIIIPSRVTSIAVLYTNGI